VLLGLPPVRYAHVPLVLAPSGARLAKRDGATTLADQARAGRTARQVLAVLGASTGLCEPDEAVTAESLRHRFDPTLVPRTPWRPEAALLGR
jgi:glutamyl-tRNA synthetase